MKRYSIVQIESGQWAVKIGRASKGRVRYLTDTVTNSKEEAQTRADVRNAEAMLEEVDRVAQNLPILDAKRLAQIARDIQITYELRAETEDPEWDPHDPGAYLC